LRVVIYDGDGNLKSLGETPLGGRTMSKDELDVLRDTLDEELGGIVAKHKDAPTPIAEPDFTLPKQAPKPAAQTMPVAAKRAAPSSEVGFVAEAPKPAEELHHDAAPTETADAVSLDDVAALNNS